MYNILTLNKISNVGLGVLTDNYTVSDTQSNPDAILLRSFKMHDYELPASLKAVARCGAGVNNIPLDKCAEKGIVVFNTPGANANAVKELVLAGLFIASRKITEADKWVQSMKGTEDVSKAVEKGKSTYAGPEIYGKTLGIIGLGAIGVLVADAAIALGMKVYGYDPYLSVDGALALNSSVKKVDTIDEIFAVSDYITIHVPATNDTKNTFNAENIAKCKDGVRILNFARGELTNSADMAEAVKSGKVAKYISDFADDDLLGVENIICLPHLGASTPEAEDNCAKMAALQMMDYLENGNIKNSVNYPALKAPRIPGKTRVCILHKNMPNVIAKFTTIFGQANINIEGLTNNSKGEYAYTVLDTDGVTDNVENTIEAIDGVIRVRVIE
ncbi:MAG: phosphoglycerate dehydrogenase [Firmicutes bacterium]|nr:phosphoglycerate dehydrogenase [Bacillota bacterium]